MQLNFRFTIPIIVTIAISVFGWVYSYGSLTSNVNENTVKIHEIKAVQYQLSDGFNKLESIDLRIKANADVNNKFLQRFDKFLDVQTQANGQIIKINTRQMYILKKIEQGQ